MPHNEDIGILANIAPRSIAGITRPKEDYGGSLSLCLLRSCHHRNLKTINKLSNWNYRERVSCNDSSSRVTNPDKEPAS